jgi:acyl-CoA synthetase (AMP-forming)/AMP-acid ligase II
VLAELLALIDTPGSPPAVRRLAGRPDTTRPELLCAVERLAVTIGRSRRDLAGTAIWVGTRDPYLMVVSTLAGLGVDSVALVDVDGPASGYDALVPVCPPQAVVCDSPATDLARWADATSTPILLVDGSELAGPGTRSAGRSRPVAIDPRIHFFSSGTTGAPKCVAVAGGALTTAVCGVVERLPLGPADTSLSITPLSHTLGMVTSVLVGLCSGGAVTFADPRRPREFLDTVAETGATWCAASPSGHAIGQRLLRDAGRAWPRLRFLRSSSAPLSPQLAAALEEFYEVPLVNAYVMTEAPGEIASQDVVGPRRAGTVGRPTLCDVDIRSAGPDTAAGADGEIWIRGPNVAVTPAATADGWVATGDLGVFDEAGFLRVTGRTHDIINQGGLKIWPPDVEAVALRHPSVAAAVAFPIPHDGLGETVGLAVVPAPEHAIDRGALRRMLMADLPRHAWPGVIVVCSQIPRSARGKIQRGSLWRVLGSPVDSVGPAL